MKSSVAIQQISALEATMEVVEAISQVRLPQEIIDKILFYLAPAQLHGDPFGSRHSVLSAGNVSKTWREEVERILERDVVFRVFRNDTSISFNGKINSADVRSMKIILYPWSNSPTTASEFPGQTSQESLSRELYNLYCEKAGYRTDMLPLSPTRQEARFLFPSSEDPDIDTDDEDPDHPLTRFVMRSSTQCWTAIQRFSNLESLDAISYYPMEPTMNYIPGVPAYEHDGLIRFGRILGQAIAHHILTEFLPTIVSTVKISQVPITIDKGMTDWLEESQAIGFLNSDWADFEESVKRLYLEFSFQTNPDGAAGDYDGVLGLCCQSLEKIGCLDYLHLSLSCPSEEFQRTIHLFDHFVDNLQCMRIEELVLKGWFVRIPTLMQLVVHSRVKKLTLEDSTISSATESALMDALCTLNFNDQSDCVPVKVINIKTCMDNSEFYAAPTALSLDAIEFAMDTVFSTEVSGWPSRRKEYAKKFPIPMEKKGRNGLSRQWYDELGKIKVTEKKKVMMLSCLFCGRQQFPNEKAFLEHCQMDHRCGIKGHMVRPRATKLEVLKLKECCIPWQ